MKLDMPKALETVAIEITKDKNRYEDIVGLLKNDMLALNNDSLSHSSFCANLKTPKNLPKELLKRFGLSDRQMLAAFESIGFHPSHKMYSDLYYQTLTFVYYIGIKSDDDILRLYALSLMFVKVFNGRKYRYFPLGCQEDIAQYILSRLREGTVFKKYPSPFIAITQYFAPTIDKTYKKQMQSDPAHPTKGLLKLLMQIWGRIDQVFLKTLQVPYYKAWNDSKKNLINLAGSDRQGVEVDKMDTSKIEKLVEKSMMNLVHRNNKFTKKDIAFFRGPSLKLKQTFIDQVELFLNDDINEDDIKNCMELILNILKIQDENNVCSMHVIHSVGKISNTKQKNNDIEKAKKHVDELLKLMYPNMIKTVSNSTLLKLRKTMLIMLVIRFKRSVCNKAEIEN